MILMTQEKTVSYSIPKGCVCPDMAVQQTKGAGAALGPVLQQACLGLPYGDNKPTGLTQGHKQLASPC